MRKKKKKNPNVITRTISDWCNLSARNQNIIRFMSHESKNIYNATIFHCQIFYQYSNSIFKDLYELMQKNSFKTVIAFDIKLYKLYDEYHQHHLQIKPFKKFNNDVIYKFITKQVKNVSIVNNNFLTIKESIITALESSDELKFPENCSIDTKQEIFYDIAFNILKSFYNKNFQKTKREILDKVKCTIDDKDFIEQVKNDIHLFSSEDPKIDYKALIKKFPLFKKPKQKKVKAKKGSKVNKKPSKAVKRETIKSNQNYITRIIYDYYKKDLKIPSDLMNNIIPKAFQAYGSFFALRKLGIKANIPKFLDKDGLFILPYFARSRKEVTIGNKEYYRLTVGQYVADHYREIADDKRLVCIPTSGIHKLYVDKKYLQKIDCSVKITEEDNYTVGNYYVPKDSKHIIEGNYIYIRKPKSLQGGKKHGKKLREQKKDLRVIEICPEYDGYRFKIHYKYNINKTKNIPIKGRRVSVDLGMVNLMVFYDPEGEQHIIKGTSIIGLNKHINNQIANAKSMLALTKPCKKQQSEIISKESFAQFNYVNGNNPNYIPIRQTRNNTLHKHMKNQLAYIQSDGKLNNFNKKQLTSKRIRNLLIYRANKINEIFNKIVDLIIEKYSDCEYIIVGYNKGWKTGVNMGKTNNRNFYEIPYRKLLNKLRDKLEKNNQTLVIREESYTSKCDPLALEPVRKHKEYLGKRIKRGLFSSSKKVLLNADLVGAINIMRKWEAANGIKRKNITGLRLCNPTILRIS